MLDRAEETELVKASYLILSGLSVPARSCLEATNRPSLAMTVPARLMDLTRCSPVRAKATWTTPVFTVID